VVFKVINLFLSQLRSSRHYSSWHRASRGPSATADPFVFILSLQGLLKDVILLAGADLSSYVCPSRRPSMPDVTFARTLRYAALYLPTALAGIIKQLVASVCLSVCLFPLWLLNRLIFELKFLFVWVMTIVDLGLKVKVIGQGQRSMSSAYGRGNAVTRSVWLRSCRHVMSIKFCLFWQPRSVSVSRSVFLWFCLCLFVCLSVCLSFCS